MRISADCKDAGYIPDHANYAVYLNNKLLRDCRTADEEQGVAWVFKRDAAGKLIGEAVIEERRGVVRVVPVEAIAARVQP